MSKQPCAHKQVYGNQALAESTAALFAQVYGTEPFRAYQCDYCGQWHLTSQSKRHHQRVKKAASAEKAIHTQTRINREAEYWTRQLLDKAELRTVRKERLTDNQRIARLRKKK